MITFLLGLFILIGGGFLLATLNARIFRPSNTVTPAHTMKDGMDYIPMGKWKNALVNLLNIAGTGPVLGPIQGILFGPVAFLTIPLGCILGGAFHDFWCGMISLREGGAQMPKLVSRYLGKHLSRLYFVFLAILLMLVGVVFVYTPGDLFVGQVLGLQKGSEHFALITVLVFAVIFLYYILATLLPIDRIIGKIYPVFGVILFVSAAAVLLILLIGCLSGKYVLNEVWEALPAWCYTGALNPETPGFIPTFFITVACGIVSGFHSSQVTLVSRTLDREQDGRLVFFGMMVIEGFIAMCWAAGAMAVLNRLSLRSAADIPSATAMVGLISRDMLWIFWIIPVASVIILPVTSGDTAFRALRLMFQDSFGMKKDNRTSLLLALGIFSVAAGILIWAKENANGFNILWRYFGFANQVIAVFTFAVITIYMIRNKKPFLLALIPGTFYLLIVTVFILHQPIGFNIENRTVCFAVGGVCALAYFIGLILFGRKKKNDQSFS